MTFEINWALKTNYLSIYCNNNKKREKKREGNGIRHPRQMGLSTNRQTNGKHARTPRNHGDPRVTRNVLFGSESEPIVTQIFDVHGIAHIALPPSRRQTPAYSMVYLPCCTWIVITKRVRFVCVTLFLVLFLSSSFFPFFLFCTSFHAMGYRGCRNDWPPGESHTNKRFPLSKTVVGQNVALDAVPAYRASIPTCT